ncbi:MAG: thiamine pyrophosphate-dependent enzyme [Candidatus Methanomethylicia archaeon]|nr:thiamine pyrophosphate-dependent enzyme [Candidatus Methanomethylicia archaeon]MCX8169027.1 thiamine pyrophosphate-dependent enzyme [Candidatus Methanomethylicia archaeon]MDW7988759.1 thiamine pyrophosphate-dependent enzyme [Nitrososphaerota archaeon]
MKHFALEYLREEVLPTPFCPGCGNGMIINAFFKAVNELGYRDLKSFVFCSGIGCGAWIPSPHFKMDTIHTLHGRAIPVATGIKMVRPELNVFVISGDGDLAGIGLGHLIHAARRDLGIKVIMVNNMIYGMTGGQVSPTTPKGIKTTTTPFGNPERPLDIVNVLSSMKVPYVAKWTTYHLVQLKNSIKKIIPIDKFAFIEVVSQCPTTYGRNIGFRKPFEMLKWFKENAVHIAKATSMSEEELNGKIIIGEYINQIEG